MKGLLSILFAHCLLVGGTLLGAESAPAEGDVDKVRLDPLDKVQYRVEEDPARSGGGNLSGGRVLTVTALGELYLPVSLGYEEEIRVQVKGRTLGEIRQEVKQRLEQDYYKTATVRLVVVDKTRRVGQALFLGEVRGVVPLPPGEQITVATAIAKLGPTEFANLKKVELYRVDPNTGEALAKPIIVDVDAVLNKGDRSKDIPLQDEDRVKVPQKRILLN